jgi:glucose-6-phosphate dehydrogenase assembly protein OpcA
MEIQSQENTVSLSTTKGIDVGKIEKELAAMWKPADKAEDSGIESGVTRACALNLLVYATATDDREQIYEMLEAVCEQHPGRALVLVADRAATEPKLDAYVSTRCRLLGGNRKQICGEQVTIEAAGAVVDTVASAIEPLLVPDVPVFLWWKDIPHYEDKLFSRMTAMSDRMVIDSSCFDSPHKDLLRLARMIKERPQFMSASDLNWGRLTAWRNLVASFWDVPDYRPHLDKIERIVVEYDPPCFAPDEIAPQSLLAVGWLASRLGWSIEENGEREEKEGASFQLRASGREIEVLMQATKREGYADGILVSLTLSVADSSAEFRVAFSDDRKKLETEARVDGARTVGRVLSYEQKTEGQRLSRELSFFKRDFIYEEALAFAAQLIEAGDKETND